MALEPITRQEQIIAGKDLKPITRMEKFLKEYGGGGSGGGAPADWNAAEGEPGHVLNRPFYVTGTQPKTLLDITITVSGNQWMGQGTIPLVEGKTYTGIWNGTAYESVCYTATVQGMEAICIGNPGILQTGENNNIPFAFGCITEYGVSAVVAMADGDYTLKITEEVPTYKRLPEEALPLVASPMVYKFPSGAFGEVGTGYPSKVVLTDISADQFMDFLWWGGTLMLDMTEVMPKLTGVLMPHRKKVIDWHYVSDGTASLLLVWVTIGEWSNNDSDPTPKYMCIQFAEGTWMPPLT